MTMRRIRLFALLTFALFSPARAQPAAAPAGSLPNWLIGSWVVVDVRQGQGVTHDPALEDPEHWFHEATMTVTRDRLTFVMDVSS